MSPGCGWHIITFVKTALLRRDLGEVERNFKISIVADWAARGEDQRISLGSVLREAASKVGALALLTFGWSSTSAAVHNPVAENEFCEIPHGIFSSYNAHDLGEFKLLMRCG
jgi:hypothetical protein